MHEEVEKREVLSPNHYLPRGRHKVYELKVGHEDLYMVQVRGTAPGGVGSMVIATIPVLAGNKRKACDLIEPMHRPGRRGVLSVKATKARVHQLGGR